MVWANLSLEIELEFKELAQTDELERKLYDLACAKREWWARMSVEERRRYHRLSWHRRKGNRVVDLEKRRARDRARYRERRAQGWIKRSKLAGK